MQKSSLFQWDADCGNRTADTGFDFRISVFSVAGLPGERRQGTGFSRSGVSRGKFLRQKFQDHLRIRLSAAGLHDLSD